MNTKLCKIIYDFQEKVEEANELLKKYLNTNEPHNWGPPIEQAGILGDKHKYFFHGAGCRFKLARRISLTSTTVPMGVLTASMSGDYVVSFALAKSNIQIHKKVISSNGFTKLLKPKK